MQLQKINDFFSEPDDGHLPDLTPLIDVIFILIVFFLLTPSIREESIDVNLPSFSSGAINTGRNIVIEIDSSDNIYFLGKKTDTESIHAMLLDLRSSSSPETVQEEVTIRSDRKSSFGTVVGLMDIIKASGFDSVSFSVTDNLSQLSGPEVKN